MVRYSQLTLTSGHCGVIVSVYLPVSCLKVGVMHRLFPDLKERGVHGRVAELGLGSGLV